MWEALLDAHADLLLLPPFHRTPPRAAQVKQQWEEHVAAAEQAAAEAEKQARAEKPRTGLCPSYWVEVQTAWAFVA